MNKLLFLLILILSGCTYHYHLNIVIGQPDPNQIQVYKDESRDLPVDQPRPLVSPQTAEPPPLSIEPGQFSASQSKGGNMINIILNINSSKPTDITTDTALSGVPGL